MGRLYPRHSKDNKNNQNVDLRTNFKAKKRTKVNESTNFQNLKNHETLKDFNNYQKANNSQNHETSQDSLKMAEVRITTDAPKLSDFSLYSDYKDNVVLWDMITDIPKTKRGAIILAGIKNSHPNFGENIQRQLLQKYRPEEIGAAEDSVAKILDFLDGHIGKPSKHLKFQCLREIVEFKRAGICRICQTV